ncbi:hypothetical protein QN362_00665 [Actimicrobium sp. CCC2.4]|uniref:hypothetical protein n=1 Tax=Actimicrobium sp. CCC2.4 TaxID=3048606 RepID=UPI002AC9997D|nr:hypothetical protein [Actimicrobium sp. CCC2.4]MEB0133836.1 hypothetical protein [Actimicrobium sp. CCC2.4]WPX31378.1 hypothetical protein RHM62_14145 [Actimicrobium sp. CCC2.4]
MSGDSLLALAARLTGRSPDDLARQAVSMLGPSAAQAGPWCSTLNNDGSPLQLCIGLSAGATPVVRLLADPAAKTSDVRQRQQELGQAVQTVLERQAPGLHTSCATLLAAMLPADMLAQAALPTSGAWLAANLSGPGMALYVSTKWGDPSARWRRAQRWLGRPVPDPLVRHADLVSAGIEGSSAANVRAKLYWRLGTRAALADLGLSLARTTEVRDFLGIVIGERHIARNAIVGSIGMDLATTTRKDAPADLKLDVCAHCVPRSRDEWLSIIDVCCRRFGLTPSTEIARMDPLTELAFIGFGLDQACRPRLNVYLKSVPS